MVCSPYFISVITHITEIMYQYFILKLKYHSSIPETFIMLLMFWTSCKNCKKSMLFTGERSAIHQVNLYLYCSASVTSEMQSSFSIGIKKQCCYSK